MYKRQIDHDGSLLDYCRLHNITLQAWSPFQMPAWKGCFLGSDEYPELNQKLQVIAEKYNVSDTTIAAAWILRHPANMQIITGTASESRLKEIIAACDITLTREEWYEPVSYTHLLLRSLSQLTTQTDRLYSTRDFYSHLDLLSKNVLRRQTRWLSLQRCV